MYTLPLSRYIISSVMCKWYVHYHILCVCLEIFQPCTRFVQPAFDPSVQAGNPAPFTSHTYRTIGSVFNDRTLYANCQPSDNVATISYDLLNNALWKAMSSEAIRSGSSYSALPGQKLLHFSAISLFLLCFSQSIFLCLHLLLPVYLPLSPLASPSLSSSVSTCFSQSIFLCLHLLFPVYLPLSPLASPSLSSSISTCFSQSIFLCLHLLLPVYLLLSPLASPSLSSSVFTCFSQSSSVSTCFSQSIFLCLHLLLPVYLPLSPLASPSLSLYMMCHYFLVEQEVLKCSHFF